MEEKVLEVEDTFLISGHGLVIVGLLEKGAPSLKIGDKIKFYCFDNSIISSEITGIEIFSFVSSEARYEFYKSNKFAFSIRDVTGKKEKLKNANMFLIK